MKIFEIYKEDSKGYRSEGILVRKHKAAKKEFKKQVREEIKAAGDNLKEMVKLNSRVNAGKGRKRITLLDIWEEDENKSIVITLKEREVM